MVLQCIRPDHGYTVDSPQIRWFCEILGSYSVEEQRAFLQFVTGSPKLPVGGFKTLTPPLTVVKRSVGADATTTSSSSNEAVAAESPAVSVTTSAASSADRCLPSVMTCVNYLKVSEHRSSLFNSTILLAFSCQITRRWR